MVFFSLVLPDVVAEARASGYPEVIMLLMLMLIMLTTTTTTTMTRKMMVKIVVFVRESKHLQDGNLKWT